MAQTSREIVKRCLDFRFPQRMPRQLWHLPWAETHYPDAIAELFRRFPGDFASPDYFYRPSPLVKGDPYKTGYYTDEWGCVFQNLHEGIIGEVRDPLISDIADWKNVRPPYEQLPASGAELQGMYDTVSRYYEKTNKFVIANINPRPWERYQFLRGSENALIDIMMPESGAAELLRAIHEFYLREVEMWVKADVDAISFMDDWGAQNQLLIHPDLWRSMFRPLYKDYCDLAHSHGKYVFMHSDGYILDIYPDLISIGVNALNSQIFCMDLNQLQQIAKGRITFWGEIDRQHILPSGNPDDGRQAVRKVAQYLYDPAGGIIAQLEFGAGANPETVLAVFGEWERIQQAYLEKST